MLDQATATAKANRLRSKAREHKRAAAQERRRARDAMQQLSEFIRECRDAGIVVIVETDQNTEPGGQSVRIDRPA